MKTDAQMNREQAARIRQRMVQSGDKHIIAMEQTLSDDQLLRMKFLVNDPRMELGELIGR